MAVHPPLRNAVAATLSSHRRVLVTAVVEELKGLATISGPVGAWAGAALGQLDWLGKPVRLDAPADLELAVELQERIAAGRPLKHPLEHFGEAAIIALGHRVQRRLHLRPAILSDDYDARVAAKNHDVEPLSVHKLMHLMIRQGKVTAAQATGFADALQKAGRAQDYTTAELTSGRLGRVGEP